MSGYPGLATEHGGKDSAPSVTSDPSAGKREGLL